jgi:quinol monooxygenase YgiN
MIIRIAEITLRPDAIERFIEEYRIVRTAFVMSDGCHTIRLLQDQGDGCSFRMLTEWQSEEHKSAFQNGGGMASWIEHLPGMLTSQNVYRYFDEVA